ncbi:MAG TPA: hypothetical protein EYP95_00995, partial [Nitrospinaceae bacterium]|nr:hypothetical protein [Nitrospinaceae bacterium]
MSLNYSFTLAALRVVFVVKGHKPFYRKMIQWKISLMNFFSMAFVFFALSISLIYVRDQEAGNSVRLFQLKIDNHDCHVQISRTPAREGYLHREMPELLTIFLAVVNYGLLFRFSVIFICYIVVLGATFKSYRTVEQDAQANFQPQPNQGTKRFIYLFNLLQKLICLQQVKPDTQR